MNAMSTPHIQPTLSSGSHTVPAATNLSKSPLPSSSSYTPLNLISENKPVTAINTSSSEKSLNLCAKQPTSNGTLSPVTVSDENFQNTSNFETGENLSVNANPIKIIEPPVDGTNTVEKNDDGKEKLPINDALSTEKENSLKTDIPIETPKNIESNFVNKDKNTELLTDGIVKPHNDIHTSPNKVETSLEKSDNELNSDKSNVIKESEKVQKDLPNEIVAPKTTKRKVKPPSEYIEEDTAEGRKSKRIRLPTQPYQSPIPELQLIAKLNTPNKTTPKTQPEKIIAFYKNEFLAVRNPEGSFYICQTFQNIHRSSSKIKIRWFTNLPQDIFTPDFYDTTEFDCILTNVKMSRMEKDRWKLSDQERTRIENILKRALDVEKGVVDKPSITEEHPDGLDLSLFKDEAQLKKRKKKKLTSPNKKLNKSEKPKKSKLKNSSKTDKTPNTSPTSVKKSPRLSSYLNQIGVSESTEKSKVILTEKTHKDKKSKKNKRKSHKKQVDVSKQNDKASTKTWEPSVKSSNTSKVILSLRKEDTSAKKSNILTETKTTKRTTSVSAKAGTNVLTMPSSNKKKKEDIKPISNNQPAAVERLGKVRNAGSAVAAKINSAAMRTTKEKERKVSNTSNQRKK